MCTSDSDPTMADPRETIAQAWASYRLAVIPADAGPQQLADCESTFYAGVQWLYWIILARIRSSDGQQAFSDHMIATGKELQAFMRDYEHRQGRPQ